MLVLAFWGVLALLGGLLALFWGAFWCFLLLALALLWLWVVLGAGWVLGGWVGGLVGGLVGWWVGGWVGGWVVPGPLPLK